MKSLTLSYILIINFLTFFITGYARAQTGLFFYINATSGNDTWSGRLPEPDADGKDGPWKTPAKVNLQAENPGFPDGTHICFRRGSRWESGESLGHNGRYMDWGTNKTLFIEDYGVGPKPVFDGDGFQPIRIEDGDNISFIVKNIRIEGAAAGNDYGIAFAALENLTLDGVEMDGFADSPGDQRIVLLGIHRIHGNVLIQHCDLRNAYYKPEGIGYWKAHGKVDQTIIYTSYAVGAAPDGGKHSGQYIIQDNVFHGAESDCIQMKGINGGHIIRRNRFSYYGENALDFKNCSAEVYENDFSRQDAPPGGSGDIGNDIVSHYHEKNYGGFPFDLEIHDNYFHDNNRNGFLMSRSDHSSFYRNYFFNQARIGIVSAMSDFRFYNNIYVNPGKPDATGDPYLIRYSSNNGDNFIFYQNSFYVGSGTGLKRIIDWSGVGGQSGNAIRGNIFQSDDTATTLLLMTGTGKPAVDHNIWYGAGNTWINIDGTGYGTHDEGLWISGNHAGDVFANPDLVDPVNGNLSLQPGSPAIDFWSGAGKEYEDAVDWLNSNFSVMPIRVETVNQDTRGKGWEAGAIVESNK